MKRLVFVVLLAACAHTVEIDPALSRATLGERSYLAWKAPAGRPLVIALHGRMGTGAGQEKLSGLLAIARRENFTVVFPDGVDRSWHDARNVGPAATQGVDDVAFLSALIDAFVEQGADPKRVYVLGMSNGGFMALTAACRLSAKLTAVASITGAVSKNLEADCPMARPVPVAFFMGTEDPLVPFDGGQVAGDRGEILSAREGAAFFAKRNGCAEAPVATELPDGDPYDGTRITLERFGRCVELYVVTGGGHTWPGGWSYARPRFIGRTSNDVSASEVAWRFFSSTSPAW